MTLREAQSLHVRLTGLLIAHAYALGYELTWGQTLRTPDDAEENAMHGAGILHSLHLIGLAVDLHLFKGGVYLEKTEDYSALGTYWESLDPLCAWGGRFHSRPDGNHFSITWQGVR